jgi:uncharacterized protein YcbK (DUF882 family)
MGYDPTMTRGLVVLWCSLVVAVAPADARRRVAKRGSPAYKRAHPSRPRPAARRTPGQRAEQVINLLNLHTGELLPVAGRGVPSAALVNRFFRCRWTHRQTQMEPRLIRWVLAAARHFGAQEVHVVSGFRHLKFNEMLRKKGRQVARRSNHRLGRAVDFRLVGVDVSRLFDYLKKRRLGGVGRYPKSKFIHLDTGRVRTWGGT